MATYRVPVLQDFAWQPPVDDRVTAPTGSESKGDRYLVIATASGDFAGLENHIVTANQDNPSDPAHWIDDTPVEGWTTWVKDEDAWYVFDGTNWNKESIDVLQSQMLVAESALSTLSNLLNDVSELTSQVDSQLLIIESEVSTNLVSIASLGAVLLTVESECSTNLVSIASLGAALLVIESEVSTNLVSIASLGAALLVLESESNDVSEALSQTMSRVLVLESEMSQAESGLATKQSQASYIAAYGCLEFTI